MAESQGIQGIFNQVAIQAATALMIALTDPHVGPQPATNTTSQKKPQRQKHSRQAQEKPSFNWNAQNMYTELLSFEMEVMNILMTE